MIDLAPIAMGSPAPCVHAKAPRRRAYDIVFMLIGTVVRDDWFIETRAILAHQSWARREAAIYVVEDDAAARRRFARCPSTDQGVPGAPLYRCLGEPSVLLAPGCTNLYYGAKGPCCKYDAAVHWFRRSPLFDRASFLVFGDDDVFFRVAGLAAALATFPDPKKTPYALHPDGFRPLWGHPECKHPDKRCRGRARDAPACDAGFGLNSGWFQPAIFSVAAVARLANASARRGLEAICADWEVTHDVALGVLLWQVEMAVGSLTRCAGQAHDGLAKLTDAVVMVHGARVDRVNRRGARAESTNHTALQRFYDERCWSGAACAADGIVEPLRGVEATAWYRNASRAPTDDFAPEDCAREQNAKRRARNETAIADCWCEPGPGGVWPHTKPCRAACPGRDRPRRLDADCGGRRWCVSGDYG